MRDWLIIISIIVIIVGGDIIMQTHLNRTADELINNLQDLKQKTISAKKIDHRENIIKQLNETEIDTQKMYLYFIQEGKCLYSGKPLNIEDLKEYCSLDAYGLVIVYQWLKNIEK